MTKKKKKVLILSGILLILVIGKVVFRIKENVDRNKRLENLHISMIYMVFPSEEYVHPSEITVDFLKKHPLPLQIDGASGLYIQSIAYEYYTGNKVDYLEIQKMVEKQNYEQIFEEYKSFMDWLAVNKEKPTGFWGRLVTLANISPEFIAWNNGKELDEYSSCEMYEKAWELFQDEMKKDLKNEMESENENSSFSKHLQFVGAFIMPK